MTASGAPTIPIPFGSPAETVTEHLVGTRVPVDDGLLATLAATGAEVLVGPAETAEASRD